MGNISISDVWKVSAPQERLGQPWRHQHKSRFQVSSTQRPQGPGTHLLHGHQLAGVNVDAGVHLPVLPFPCEQGQTCCSQPPKPGHSNSSKCIVMSPHPDSTFIYLECAYHSLLLQDPNYFWMFPDHLSLGQSFHYVLLVNRIELTGKSQKRHEGELWALWSTLRSPLWPWRRSGPGVGGMAGISLLPPQWASLLPVQACGRLAGYSTKTPPETLN